MILYNLNVIKVLLNNVKFILKMKINVKNVILVIILNQI